ncbi:hypothetical protein CAI16_19020 [Virgibacillus dokdonensis]|uniref:ABC transporter domain-containing protein n=1 Tax=Virgibacillus dokdonensis TaxID=302167 RepID=A0A3E0WIP5_9BACI|nr:ATP-binding cassette domain-containing protein [Virgibacillus dokdonensis]RFA32093.1 hypothetical protein CAI16_19020 [Virgibacillus dokdonensis]
MKVKVEVKNVYKAFQMYAKQSDKLLDLFQLKNRKSVREFLAVKDVSFEVFEGETVGIVGLNGSGKSTLSNMLAQVIQPTSGTIKINGETSLIAISAGLNTNLTGLENIDLKCMMHGLSKAQIEQVKPDIIEFADIGDYIYQPVKNYSSGMRARIGFAISVHTDPDILIIDEALSVGDSTFTQRCLLKMEEFKKKGKTIFFISHSSSQVQKFCEKVIWMHYGGVKEFGESKEVIKKYQNFVKWFNQLKVEEKKQHKQEMLDDQIQSISKRKQNKQEIERKRTTTGILSMIAMLSMLVVSGILVVLGYN